MSGRKLLIIQDVPVDQGFYELAGEVEKRFENEAGESFHCEVQRSDDYMVHATAHADRDPVELLAVSCCLMYASVCHSFNCNIYIFLQKLKLNASSVLNLFFLLKFIDVLNWFSITLNGCIVYFTKKSRTSWKRSE